MAIGKTSLAGGARREESSNSTLLVAATDALAAPEVDESSRVAAELRGLIAEPKTLPVLAGGTQGEARCVPET